MGDGEKAGGVGLWSARAGDGGGAHTHVAGDGDNANTGAAS